MLHDFGDENDDDASEARERASSADPPARRPHWFEQEHDVSLEPWAAAVGMAAPPPPPPPPKPEGPQHLQEGERVVVHRKRGVVRFVGPTEFMEGTWVGIRLDNAIAKSFYNSLERHHLFYSVGVNDGTMIGKRYFTCEPDHALFARVDVVQRESEFDSAVDKQAKAEGEAEINRRPLRPTSGRSAWNRKKVCTTEPEILAAPEHRISEAMQKVKMSELKVRAHVKGKEARKREVLADNYNIEPAPIVPLLEQRAKKPPKSKSAAAAVAKRALRPLNLPSERVRNPRMLDIERRLELA